MATADPSLVQVARLWGSKGSLGLICVDLHGEGGSQRTIGWHRLGSGVVRAQHFHPTGGLGLGWGCNGLGALGLLPP